MVDFFTSVSAPVAHCRPPYDKAEPTCRVLRPVRLKLPWPSPKSRLKTLCSSFQASDERCYEARAPKCPSCSLRVTLKHISAPGKIPRETSRITSSPFLLNRMVRSRPLKSRKTSLAGSPATKMKSRATESFGRAAAKTCWQARFGGSANGSQRSTTGYCLVVKFIGSAGELSTYATEACRLTGEKCADILLAERRCL